MDVLTLVALHDQFVHSEIDHRLYFTQREGQMVESTRTVVYATDPLKDISNPLESLLTVPTDPPSKRVQLIGGHFFANGKLYVFPGMETDDIVIDMNQDTYVLTGVKIDPKTDKTDFYIQTTYGEYPFMDRDMVPSALIKIPAGFDTIMSGHIIDLRPFIHYNVSTPEDRAVIDVSCINPKESVTFELMRNRRTPPIMNFYKKVPPEGTHTITHSFKSMDDIILLGDDPAECTEAGGVTLKRQITANPITMPDSPSTIFVSPLTGSDYNDGSASYPLASLGAAIDRYNGMSQYDTILLYEGIYSLNVPKVITRDCLIVGEAPTKVSIRFADNRQTVLTNVLGTRTKFRTIQFLNAAPKQAGSVSFLMEFEGDVDFNNCIFKQTTSAEVLAYLKHHRNFKAINCIIHNPYYAAANARSFFYITESPFGIPSILNSFVIGQWKTVFTTGLATRTHIDTGNGSSLQLEDLTSYYHTPSTTALHSGLPVDGIDTDLDGSLISPGLYGGPYASMFRTWTYPINEMPVFRYTYHTLYSPIISRFVSVTPIMNFISAECKVFGALSFNGGHDWVVWDEFLGAWKRIADLETLDVNGNSAEDLCYRLVNNGPITTNGELCFAWALKSSNPAVSPHLYGVSMTVKADADTLTPIQPENLSVYVAGDTVMVTNLSDEKQNDVVIVAY